MVGAAGLGAASLPTAQFNPVNSEIALAGASLANQCSLFLASKARVSICGNALWQRFEIPVREVQLAQEISTGAYSSVYEGNLRGEVCAVKKMHNDKMSEQVIAEIQISGSLSHPNTLRLIAWTRNPLQLVLELAEGDVRCYYEGKIKTLPGYTIAHALTIFLHTAR